MKRRINHTGRQKIDKSNITIRLIDQAPKPLKFTAKLVLEKQELPNNAKVFVEAYHKNTTQRFDFGTVENITPPTDTTLNEVDPQGTTKFRIMVVDNKQQPGKLLAGAINISA
ncbi:MAG: hypothetical protein JAY84_09660, partial [Candidatus Thiodiazotropha taylori]|nr:hypothetical protein [Candidatus Thiodiazotropha taylori]